jgi:hypothetical protein
MYALFSSRIFLGGAGGLSCVGILYACCMYPVAITLGNVNDYEGFGVFDYDYESE